MNIFDKIKDAVMEPEPGSGTQTKIQAPQYKH